MTKILDLQKAFNEYFLELEGYHLRCERFYNDVEMAPPDRMVEWMQAAFMEGARAMANDTIDTLRDYGTSMAGIDSLVYTPTEAFDMAAENLEPYFRQLFDKDENGV